MLLETPVGVAINGVVRVFNKRGLFVHEAGLKPLPLQSAHSLTCSMVMRVDSQGVD
jgi:hypothetical protein